MQGSCIKQYDSWNKASSRGSKKVEKVVQNPTFVKSLAQKIGPMDFSAYKKLITCSQLLEIVFRTIIAAPKNVHTSKLEARRSKPTSTSPGPFLHPCMATFGMQSQAPHVSILLLPLICFQILIFKKSIFRMVLNIFNLFIYLFYFSLFILFFSSSSFLES